MANSIRHHHTRAERMVPLAVVFTALFGMCSVAHALTSDRSQVINVNANHSLMSQDNEKAVLSGHVRIDQGSLHADGDNGIGHFDQNNALQRMVLTGAPAHFQQKLDNGSMVHGSAASIDYIVSENTVILTGNATVVQQGRGEFHGAKLTYNTDSGQIVGDGGTGGQVHMVFQPKPKAGAKPARGKPAPPARSPAGSSIPSPAAAASIPAPASTIGSH